MMIHEFTARTKYNPTPEEYHYIEESYYDSRLFKDEFCKAWLKLKRSGAWETELRLRKIIDNQKALHAKDMAEQQEAIDWYAEQFDKLWARGLRVTVTTQDGKKRIFENATCNYVDNGTVKFYAIKEKNCNWPTCYKLDDVKDMQIAF